MPTSNQDRAFIGVIMSNSPLDETIDWIANNLAPDDVFDENTLGEWALINGYVKDPGTDD